jgi:predicted dehydrogenase
MKRRNFVKTSSIIGATVSAIPQSIFSTNTLFKNKLNIAIIGVGMRGQSHIDLLLNRDDVNVVAIADPDQTMISSTQDIFKSKNHKSPKIYDNGNYDYLNLLSKENIDGVIIATPWEWHSEMAIAAMNANIFCGLEVSGAFSLDECWQLVNTYEKTKSSVYFLENVCFRRDVMAILNMVRQDLFGELIHLECGYQHDLRGVKFNDGITPYNSGVEFGDKGFSEAKWRTNHSVHRNGDLYPTHGIGPISQYIGINRGNRLVSLTSMASKARGLHEYILNHPKGGKNHINSDVEFKLGDKVTTMLSTAKGETIVMHHDTNLPRPYSLGFRVQGTKGLWMDVNNSIHIEGRSPGHKWEDASTYLDKYDHPIWKKNHQKAIGAGHGGMDYFLVDSFIDCIKNQKRPPFDIYDAATWMSLTPLSEISVASGGTLQNIPDFTNGEWISRKNNFAINETY